MSQQVFELFDTDKDKYRGNLWMLCLKKGKICYTGILELYNQSALIPLSKSTLTATQKTRNIQNIY